MPIFLVIYVLNPKNKSTEVQHQLVCLPVGPTCTKNQDSWKKFPLSGKHLWFTYMAVCRGHRLALAKWCTLMHGLDVGHICWIHKWQRQETDCHGTDVNELYGNFCNLCNVMIFIQLLQVLMTILLKRFSIRIILMGRRQHLAASKTFLKLLRLQPHCMGGRGRRGL